MKRSSADPANESISLQHHLELTRQSRRGGRKGSRRPFLALISSSLIFGAALYCWVISHLDIKFALVENHMTAPNYQRVKDRQSRHSDKDVGKNCDGLSIYPPHLSSQAKSNKTKVCGRLFYPLDFAMHVVSEGYNWNQTGFTYYATGIGIHHVTFDRPKYPRHNLMYNSMMKCGSTSVNRALKELARATRENFVPADDTQPLQMDVVYRGKENNLMLQPAKKLMGELYQYQKQEQLLQRPESYQYFTTVRDPVKRFVSAIAQEMYVHNAKDRKATAFRSKCLLATPEETLQCSIKHVRECFSGKNPMVQPHFIPMSTVLFRRTYGYNVSVLLFPITEVSSIVSQMVAGSRQAQFSKLKNKLKAQGSPILKHMTVDYLSDTMVKDICDLYKIDVLMMKQNGFPAMCP